MNENTNTNENETTNENENATNPFLSLSKEEVNRLRKISLNEFNQDKLDKPSDKEIADTAEALHNLFEERINPSFAEKIALYLKNRDKLN